MTLVPNRMRSVMVPATANMVSASTPNSWEHQAVSTPTSSNMAICSRKPDSRLSPPSDIP